MNMLRLITWTVTAVQNASNLERAKSLIRLFMPEPKVDTEEFHSEGADSEDVEINRNLFKDIAFFLHESIKKNFSRRNLTRDIERHGGTVLDTDIGCDTVLVDVTYDKKETLRISYNADDNPLLRKVFVESTYFIQHCIRNNLFVHRIPALKGMGGTIGRVRVPFTELDDEYLCSYLARILPDRAAGGRSGLKVYEKLVDADAVRPAYAWGARHTAESWKERYKKNATKFDKRIDDLVKLEGRSRKQLWPEDRRTGHKVLRGKHKYEPKDLEGLSEGDYDLEDEHPRPSRKRRRPDYSPPPPNRQQVVQRPSDEKGKARAVEEEEEEESDMFEYLFSVDEDEPGPSRSRHSLEATAVNLTHQTTQPNTVNTANFLSQETIVVSAPSGRSMQSKEASQRTLVNPSRTQAAQPSTYKQPLKAARRPRAMIEAADAPYTNTRSRSRSVQPYMSNSPVRVSKKGKLEAMPELATVDEIRDDRQGSENLSEVEKILVEELNDTNQVRGVSLDTDDAQTDQNLWPTQPPRIHPLDILKEFQQHSAIWTSQSLVPLTGRSHYLSDNRPAVPVRNTQENPFTIPSPSLSHNVSVAYKAAEPPRTPFTRLRNDSISSTELFPVSGTRASALKKELQQKEKRSSYNPPSGTRAAKLARSRI